MLQLDAQCQHQLREGHVEAHAGDLDVGQDLHQRVVVGVRGRRQPKRCQEAQVKPVCGGGVF